MTLPAVTGVTQGLEICQRDRRPFRHLYNILFYLNLVVL